MLDSTGRVVMVSGANRGLGLAIARRLATEGYQLSLGARDTDALGEVAPEGALVSGYDADRRDTLPAWVDATVDRFGRIDVVVNNAGVLDTASFEDLDEARLDAMWNVNVKAPLRLTQLALPHLRAAGNGRIVNVASLSGKRVKGTFAPGYAMTKFAVVGLSHALRQATWDDGIRVVALCPGYVATDMVDVTGLDPATMIQPGDLAELVATVIALPNTAAIAELLVNPRLEPML